MMLLFVWPPCVFPIPKLRKAALYLMEKVHEIGHLPQRRTLGSWLGSLLRNETSSINRGRHAWGLAIVSRRLSSVSAAPELPSVKKDHCHWGACVGDFLFHLFCFLFSFCQKVIFYFLKSFLGVVWNLFGAVGPFAHRLTLALTERLGPLPTRGDSILAVRIPCSQRKRKYPCCVSTAAALCRTFIFSFIPTFFF